MKNLNFGSRYDSGRTSIEVNLALLEFMEDDNFIIYSPALDVSGYGKTKAEALKSFEIGLEEFFSYTIEKGTFEKELIRLGWEFDRQRTKFKQPYFDELLRNREYLSQVVREKEFSKINSKYKIPAFA